MYENWMADVARPSPAEDPLDALMRALMANRPAQQEDDGEASSLQKVMAGLSDIFANYAALKTGAPQQDVLGQLRKRRDERNAEDRRGEAQRQADVLDLNKMKIRRQQEIADRSADVALDDRRRLKATEDQRLSQALDDARKVPGLNLQGVENTPEAIGAAISRQMEVNAKTKREQELQDLKAIDQRQAARDAAIEQRQTQREKAQADATDEKIQRAQVGPFLASISARARDIVAKNENVDPETERNDFLNDLEDHGLTGPYRDQAIKRFQEKIEPILRAKEAQAIGAEINRKKAEFDAAEKAKKAVQSVRAGYGLGS